MYQSNFVIEKITLKKTNKLEQHVKNYYVSLALLYSSILYFYVKKITSIMIHNVETWLSVIVVSNRGL